MNKFIFVFSFLWLASCATLQTAKLEEQISLETEVLPASDLKILDHKYYVVMYDTKYRLARAVIYTVTADQLKKSIPGSRKDAFKADPILKAEKIAVVYPKEYEKTGYDQGHLANSKDFTFDKAANEATFYMSNMVPQKPDLNRDAWRKLEDQTRLWACGEEKISIITGPILKPGLTSLKSGLPVPEEFYKIILDETPPKKMLAFIYTQSDKGNLINERQVNIETLKRKVLHQMNKESFADYPMEEIGTWKAVNCMPKRTKVVTK